jgi:hypothetical protein
MNTCGVSLELKLLSYRQRGERIKLITPPWSTTAYSRPKKDEAAAAKYRNADKPAVLHGKRQTSERRGLSWLVCAARSAFGRFHRNRRKEMMVACRSDKSMAPGMATRTELLDDGSIEIEFARVSGSQCSRMHCLDRVFDKRVASITAPQSERRFSKTSLATSDPWEALRRSVVGARARSFPVSSWSDGLEAPVIFAVRAAGK